MDGHLGGVPRNVGRVVARAEDQPGGEEEEGGPGR